MKLKQIKSFIQECIEKGVVIPQELTLVVSDFNQEIPIEFQNLKPLEYNVKSKNGRFAAKILIVK